MNTTAKKENSEQRNQDKRSDKGDLPGKMIDPDELDSKVNTDFNDRSGKSLTQQESPDTDPNKVDKSGFERSNV